MPDFRGGEILRFAQNDTALDFFRTLLEVSLSFALENTARRLLRVLGAVVIQFRFRDSVTGLGRMIRVGSRLAPELQRTNVGPILETCLMGNKRCVPNRQGELAQLTIFLHVKRVLPE